MSKYDDHYDAGYEAYIDGIHRDIADLQAEKDRLADAAKRWMGKAAQLEAERDGLRELVRDMARAWWACDNERCPHGSSCDAAVSEGKLADCEMERRMAELGVEVEK